MNNLIQRSFKKAWRALLLGGALICMPWAALAQERWGDPRWSPGGTDALRGRLVDVAVLDANSQRALGLYPHAGRYYVAGTPGQPYRVLLTNRSAARVMAVVSVDGINVLSGSNASTTQNGYVLGPYQSATIDGWRKSLSHVARFEFATPADSYAGRTGRGHQVGVIGVAVFQERPRRPIALPAPELGRADGAREANAPTAAQRSLGTGHGESEWSPVNPTAFDRATAYPAETLRVEYDRWEALVRRGIVPRAPRRNPEPDPFPGQFVPDPPRRW